MEEIDLQELFKFYLKKIHLILIVVVLVTSIGFIYTFFIKTPLYNSEVTAILVNKYDGSSQIVQNDITLNQKLVATYREIAKSRDVLKQVKEILKLDYSLETLSSMINVIGVSDTEILKITVQGSDAKEVANIANELTEVFKEKVMIIYNLENVSIIDKAEINNNPYNVNKLKDLVIFFLVGMVLSCSIIFTLYYFDNTVKSSEQIEKKIGIPVIGSVPRIGKKGKR